MFANYALFTLLCFTSLRPPSPGAQLTMTIHLHSDGLGRRTKFGANLGRYACLFIAAYRNTRNTPLEAYYVNIGLNVIYKTGCIYRIATLGAEDRGRIIASNPLLLQQLVDKAYVPAFAGKLAD